MSTYTLCFSWSRSHRYPRAVTLATTVAGTIVSGAGREQTHRVPLDATALPALGELLPLVAGWRATRVWQGARPLPPRAVGALQQVLACAQEREWSGLGPLHCQGRQRAWGQRVPCGVLDRALPDRVLADPDPEQRATLVRGLARTTLAAACPAFDAAAVRAAVRQGAAGPRPWGRDLAGPDGDAREDRARFERLLGDLRLE